MSSEYKGDLSDLVNKILARPDLVAEIAAMLAPQEQSDAENATREQEKTVATSAGPKTSDESDSKPSERRQKESKDAKRENRRQLLAALRPFLSAGRQNALDSIESVATLLDITRS